MVDPNVAGFWTLGMFLAAFISWMTYHSIVISIVSWLFSWIYVAFWLFTRFG